MSEKSVAQKLGLKSGKTLFVSHAPVPVSELLGATPNDARVTETGKGPFPLILLFARDHAAMARQLPLCKAKLKSGGALWLAYAKGTSAMATDINRDRIREYVGGIGLDTVAQIAIDADWSALRLKVV
jgi:hypothetical protein